jgi:hypothetical protein
MGATKKRRQTKHRGNAAGMVEAPGRTGGRNGGSSGPALMANGRKPPKPPTWMSAYKKAIIPVVILAPILLFVGNSGKNPLTIIPLLVIAYVAYVPLSYASDKFIYSRYLKAQAAPKPVEAKTDAKAKPAAPKTDAKSK